MHEIHRLRALAKVAVLAAAAATACGGGFGPVNAPGSTRSARAEEWFTRAKASYHAGDFADARASAKHALDAAPKDDEIRTMLGRIDLATLDFSEAVKVTEGMDSTDAHAIRGRARWYAGDVDQAADELEAMLADPKVKDTWATSVAKLAREGAGRHPFALEGGIVAKVDMPRDIGDVPLGAALVVPCDLEGEHVLALVATGSSEVYVDSASRREPAWVSFRFADTIEVNDVPALTQDLSPLSHQLGVPIKAMLGVNFLRHTHATFDRRGDQFIVRRFEPQPPPDGSRVPLWYLHGAAMTLRVGLTPKLGVESPMYVDTEKFIPDEEFLRVALDETLWKTSGADMRKLQPLAHSPNVRRGTLPSFRLGGFDLATMPALQGLDFSELQATNVDVEVGGVVGAGLLSLFRVTFADEGRFIWIEPDPMLVGGAPSSGARPPPPTQTGPTTMPSQLTDPMSPNPMGSTYAPSPTMPTMPPGRAP